MSAAVERDKTANAGPRSLTPDEAYVIREYITTKAFIERLFKAQGDDRKILVNELAANLNATLRHFRNHHRALLWDVEKHWRLDVKLRPIGATPATVQEDQP